MTILVVLFHSELRMSKGNETWGRRLKEARTASGLSQKQIGILAGLDPSVASTRINRYELAIHKPDFNIVEKLADVLKVPTAYFYAEEDNLAEIMLIYHRLAAKKKSALLKAARQFNDNATQM